MKTRTIILFEACTFLETLTNLTTIEWTVIQKNYSKYFSNYLDPTLGSHLYCKFIHLLGMVVSVVLLMDLGVSLEETILLGK